MRLAELVTCEGASRGRHSIAPRGSTKGSRQEFPPSGVSQQTPINQNGKFAISVSFMRRRSGQKGGETAKHVETARVLVEAARLLVEY